MAFTWRTSVKLPTYPQQITYDQGLLCLGSCFAEHIGSYLQDRKYNTLINPMGILYNPVSLQRALQRLSGDQPYTKADLFFHEGLWYSNDHHGRYAHPQWQEALANMQRDLQAGRHHLRRSSWLLLTLGTAFVWRQKDNRQVVANCHRRPPDQFDRERLDTHTIYQALATALRAARSVNPGIGIILTVSPVRYLRDGLIDSQRSKAALLLAVEQVERQFPSVFYFPAYEILIDELRDYRFYDRDGTHPADLAIDYIFQQFCQVLVAPNSREIMAEVDQIRSAARHRPLHPATPAHQNFLRKQLEKIAQMETKWPFLDFSKEKSVFLNQKT